MLTNQGADEATVSAARPAADAVSLAFEGICHDFADVHAVRDASLRVGPGHFVTILGPSGSGKTTLLRIAAGLLTPTRGRVLIGETDVTLLPAAKREIGFVFQHYALFPHLNVFENVAFPLRLRHIARGEIERRVAETLEFVDLAKFGTRRPAQLSGGQQQRVALARALVFNPKLLLMDEPLGSLDKRLRQQLQVELRRLQREVGITTVYVTHDQDEAFSMSDEVVVMNEGIIHQTGTPRDIYSHPADYFVARFVGDVNCFTCEVLEHSGELATLQSEGGLRIIVPSNDVVALRGPIGCTVRPERVEWLDRRTNMLQPGDEARNQPIEVPGENAYQATVRTITFLGTHQAVELVLQSGEPLKALVAADLPLSEGMTVNVGWRPQDTYCCTP